MRVGDSEYHLLSFQGAVEWRGREVCTPREMEVRISPSEDEGFEFHFLFPSDCSGETLVLVGRSRVRSRSFVDL